MTLADPPPPRMEFSIIFFFLFEPFPNPNGWWGVLIVMAFFSDGCFSHAPALMAVAKF